MSCWINEKFNTNLFYDLIVIGVFNYGLAWEFVSLLGTVIVKSEEESFGQPSSGQSSGT